MENETQKTAEILIQVLANQMKLLASSQVLMIQQTRLVAALTQVDPLALMEEYDALFLEEKNKLQLAMLADLRALRGGPQIDASGGSTEAAG